MKNKTTAGILLVLMIAAAISFLKFGTHKAGSKTVAKAEEGLIFSITAYEGKGSFFVRDLGHAWLAIDNGLDKTVVLCGNEIKPGEQMTFSVWAISSRCGPVFNLEPRLICLEKRYSGRKTLQTRISESDLQTMEKFILEHDRWTFTENCSKWSVTLWNAVVGEEYRIDVKSPICTPSLLEKAITEFSCAETDKEFSTAGKTFFFTDGKITEAELCH